VKKEKKCDKGKQHCINFISFVRVNFSTHKHIFLTYSSIAMWLTVLHLPLVHSHVLNIGKKAQPDLHQSKHRRESPARPAPIKTSERKPSPTCTNKNIGDKAQSDQHKSTNQNIGQKAQLKLHKSEHRRESPVRPAPIKTSDRKPSLSCTNQNI
jgi:hypothetical protein